MNTDTVNTEALLSLLGCGSDDAALQHFLAAHRVHDRPKTVAQLEDEEFIEDDGETDIEYELARAAEESLILESERFGFCLIFRTREDYALVHDVLPKTPDAFVLEEVGLFTKGVQIYQQYHGALPGGFSFTTTRHDSNYRALGTPIARRDVHETSIDLFVLDERIVNFGFGEGSDGQLLYVHIRQQHHFDQKMLAPNNSDSTKTRPTSILDAAQIGHPVKSTAVMSLLATLGIDKDDMYNGEYPEEITRLTQPSGITLYFRNIKEGGKEADGGKRKAATRVQHLSSVSYKRRGDLGSKGFQGALPFAFEFGDTPQTLLEKVGRVPTKEHRSYELMSYYWKLDSGLIVQAVCSLIDWQLYRVNCFAEFMESEFF